MKSFRISIAIIIVAVSLIACTKETDNIDPTVGLIKITDGYAAGAATNVAVYSSKALQTGYNKLYLILTDSLDHSYVEDAHITISPMMDMTTMKHTCPIENPFTTAAIDHRFPCSAFFIMSSGMMGSWTLSIQVHNHKTNKEGSLTLPININAPTYNPMTSFTSLADGTKYFIALAEPSKPKIGINDLEFVVYKKQSMMMFPADSSLTIKITPAMPTMGHGSPNNINPVHIGNGHYKGKVNFTMTGMWRLNLNCFKGDAVADSTAYIDLNF